MKTYNITDLIGMARIGSFGNETNNRLALQAFLRLQYLEDYVKNLEYRVSLFTDIDDDTDTQEIQVENESIN